MSLPPKEWFVRICNEEAQAMKKLLKIPAVLFWMSAFWVWISYDEYISIIEVFFPFLNYPGVLKQGVNWMFVSVLAAIGYMLWEIATRENTEKKPE